jgi:NADPH-dependent ferric siderophore reductase
MLRITFTGDDLADFVSLAPDDHMKILVPGESGGQERRDYTPRRFNQEARTLDIDFALHEAGPATRWALEARPGDRLEVGGPRGSAVIEPGIGRWLLIGDETALPAIGRRTEEEAAGIAITSLVAVAGPEEHQTFTTRAALTNHWIHRPLSSAGDPEPILSMLKGMEIEAGTFVWIAAEANVVRAVRDYLLAERHQPRGWIKAAGYWLKGRADAHEKFD